jgi:hypothetical protein
MNLLVNAMVIGGSPGDVRDSRVYLALAAVTEIPRRSGGRAKPCLLRYPAMSWQR